MGGSFSELVKEGVIEFLEAKSRDEALRTLVSSLVSKGKVRDGEQFLQAVLAREEIVTTGIGNGVALPHAKLSKIKRFFLAIGIDRQGIDWQALDGTPVRLIFLIGGPDDKYSEYLQLLSWITQMVKEESRRKRLLQAERAEDVIALLR